MNNPRSKLPGPLDHRAQLRVGSLRDMEAVKGEDAYKPGGRGGGTEGGTEGGKGLGQHQGLLGSFSRRE